MRHTSPLPRRPVWAGPVALSALLALGGALPASAAPQKSPSQSSQSQGSQRSEALELYVYKFQHQRALEAVELVESMLSPGGAVVEVRPGDNTLVIRDSKRALSAIVPALKQFDHPPRELAIALTIVQATRANFSPLVDEEPLPAELAAQLKALLRYSTFRVLATTTLETAEGESVTYELGEEFGVSFKTGMLKALGKGAGPSSAQQIKLSGFRVSRTQDGVSKSLLSTTMNLQLGQPMALTLASSEGSNKALVVVLEPTLRDAGDDR